MEKWHRRFNGMAFPPLWFALYQQPGGADNTVLWQDVPNTPLTAPSCPAPPLLGQLRHAPVKRAELPQSMGWWRCVGQHRDLSSPRDKSDLEPKRTFCFRWSNSKLDASSPEFHPDCPVSFSDDILPRTLGQAKHVRGRDKFPKCSQREWLRDVNRREVQE